MPERLRDKGHAISSRRCGVGSVEPAAIAAYRFASRLRVSRTVVVLDRAAMARIARDLRYWTSRHSTAEVVHPPNDAAVVRFGCEVTIARNGDRRETYRIVGEDEAEPSRGTLSYVSPLARSLIGRQVGDVVRVGSSEAEILEIKF